MDYSAVGAISTRIRVTDYVSVTQIYLRNNFTLSRPLEPSDIKPRLLGHWGTCHGINVFYTNIKTWNPEAHCMIGPGHGFPALQAQLWLDGKLEQYYPEATITESGLAYISKQFSWPYGFPSHSSPETPEVILEGGELGYCVGVAYGAALNRPGSTIAVLIGDGEMETASLLASLNLNKFIVNGRGNGRVLPVLHLNDYKISAPTIYGRISEHELHSLIRGFGYTPIDIDGDDAEAFQMALRASERYNYPFIIMRTPKGETGPAYVDGKKIAGNYLSHQVPLGHAATDENELRQLETWLRSYNINWQEVFHA